MDSKSHVLALTLLCSACTGATSSSGQPCSQLSAKAKAEVESAVAAADNTCTVDADCTTVLPATCYSSCEYPVAKAAAASIESVVQHVNSTTCAEFNSDGCQGGGPCEGPARHVACVDRHCGEIDDIH